MNRQGENWKSRLPSSRFERGNLEYLRVLRRVDLNFCVRGILSRGSTSGGKLKNNSAEEKKNEQKTKTTKQKKKNVAENKAVDDVPFHTEHKAMDEVKRERQDV